MIENFIIAYYYKKIREIRERLIKEWFYGHNQNDSQRFISSWRESYY